MKTGTYKITRLGIKTVIADFDKHLQAEGLMTFDDFSQEEIASVITKAISLIPKETAVELGYIEVLEETA
jgi:hypothetical protein